MTERTTMERVTQFLGRRLWVCRTHRANNGRHCSSCQAAMHFNLSRQSCLVCGEPANGYRTLGADVPVEFFCDEHWQDVPIAVSEPQP